VRPLDAADKSKLVELARGAGALKAIEPPLPTNVLDRLAGFPLHELASTLTALGIPLKPEEFQRIILVKVGQRPLAEKLARSRVVFDEYKRASSTPAWARPLEQFEPSAVNEKIALLLQPYVSQRSAYPEPLLGRLRQLDKRAEPSDRSPTIYNPQWYPRAANDDSAPPRPPSMAAFVPAALALAAGFLLLKEQFPQLAATGPLAIVQRHPWLLPILLSGGVGAAVGLHSLLAPRPLNEARVVDGMRRGPYDALSKTASMEVPWMRLGLVPMAYVYAGVQPERTEHGGPLRSIDSFIAAPVAERGVKGVLKHAAADGETDLLNRMVRIDKRNLGETHAHAR
jgi:hypothetical protein